MQENDFISSNHGGWQFNDAECGTNENSGSGLSPDFVHMSPEVPEDLPSVQLETNAFFNFSSILIFGDTTFTADNALEGAAGSVYARANRDRILSDAVPAMTLPIGANLVPALDAIDRNVDMQTTFEVNGWLQRPALEAQKWHHSDFDFVAYPFTHLLFDTIISDANLK